MRELYLDDIPMGSSDDSYENFLGKRFKMGRPVYGQPVGTQQPPMQESDKCERDWQIYSSTIRFATKEDLIRAKKQFIKNCRQGKGQSLAIGRNFGLPKPFKVAEIKVQPEPVYKPVVEETPVYTQDNTIPDEPKMRDEVIERRTRPISPFGRFRNRLNLGVQGIFGSIFRRRMKRPMPEMKSITIRAREIWNKDMENWSEALKRAEKELVKEGDVTPVTYLNFDSMGNVVGYEHETYDDDNEIEDYMEETEDYSGFCGNCG